MPVGQADTAGSVVTRCPRCATAFRASAQQLAVRSGLVRCGRCQEVFNARVHAIATQTPAPAANPAAASPEPDGAFYDATSFIVAPLEPAPPPSPPAIKVASDIQQTRASADSGQAPSESSHASERQPDAALQDSVPPFAASHNAAERERSDESGHAVQHATEQPPSGQQPDMEPPAAEYSQAETEPEPAETTADVVAPGAPPSDLDIALAALEAMPPEAEPSLVDIQSPTASAAAMTLDPRGPLPSGTAAPPAELPAATEAEQVEGALELPAPAEEASRLEALGRAEADPALAADIAELPPVAESPEAPDAPRAPLDLDFGRKRKTRRTPLWLSIPGALILLLLLAGQAAYFFRGDLVLLFPAVKPPAQQLCAWAGCDLPAPRRADFMSIETSDLQPDASNPGVMVLSAMLRNRAPFAQAQPSLELTLTDSQDQALARRVLSAGDYVVSGARGGASPASSFPAALFPANSEQAIKVYFDASAVKATGYRVYLFYP